MRQQVQLPSSAPGAMVQSKGSPEDLGFLSLLETDEHMLSPPSLQWTIL